MAELWPQLRESGKTVFSCYWTGPLSTRLKQYEIEIQYIRPKKLDIGRLRSELNVYVITPLKLHGSSTQLPHIYKEDAAPNGGRICLYYPGDEGSWNFTELIAHKIVPWLAEWLLFYEGWLVTGEWFADGLEPSDLEHERWRDQHSATDAQTVPFRRDADLYIGTETGTFVSYPLMVAASKDSSQPLSWRDWKENISTGQALHLALTTYLEHQPAE